MSKERELHHLSGWMTFNEMVTIIGLVSAISSPFIGTGHGEVICTAPIIALLGFINFHLLFDKYCETSKTN